MKKSVLVMMCIGVLMFAGIASAGLDDGLVAHYPFDGNANDTSGNGHNGTVDGATLVDDRLGNAGSAYYFDGVNDKIVVPEDGSFNVGNQLTVSLWIRFPADPPCRVVSFVSKSAAYVGPNTGYIFPYLNFGGCGSFGLIVNTDWWHFKRSYSYYSIPDPYSWHLYTGTYDGTARRMYLDGALVSVDYQSGTIKSNSNNLVIGVQPGTNEWAHAEMDDIRIYDRALGSDEVLALYQSYMARTVDIDIKPGSDPNCINNNGKGVIPVAVLGSDELDVADIDAWSLTLDSMSVKTVGKGDRLVAGYEDVNGDGHLDLVVKIDDTEGTYQEGDDTGTLTGMLLDGTRIEGTDSICLVP